MFITQNKNSYVPPVKGKAQKSSKEKTMAVQPVTNLSQIDITKPLTQEEMALINWSREQNEEEKSLALNTNTNIANNPIVLNQPSGCVQDYEEDRRKTIQKQKKALISSAVGERVSTKDKKANLGTDVAFVQGHLLRLGMLSKEDYETEKINTPESVDKNKIPKTIKAIWEFQQDVLGYGGDGYASPDGGTVKNLTALTPEEVEVKKALLIEKKKKEVLAAKVKAIAEKEAKENAILDEKIKKIREDFKLFTIVLHVHDAIYGLQTDEEKVYAALARLNNDARLITRFKEAYKKRYQADVVKDIEGDFSFEEEDRALGYLNALEKKEVSKENSKTVSTIIEKDDFRSQSTKAAKGIKDSEPGSKRCKLVAEKMVYRQLYEDLDAEFKRSDVTTESTGKYKHIVGTVGDGEYLRVLSEDKSEYKNIKEGVHKQSTFTEAPAKEQALEYLDKYLDEGIAVVVGVDHTFNRTLEKDTPKTTSKNTFGYNDGTTDHFIVVVGKGVTKDGKKYYQFYDPGTSQKATGTKESNKLVENDKGQYEGKQPWNANRSYHLTMVFLFKKDKCDYNKEIKKNESNRESLKDNYNKKTGHFKTE